jgi:biotin transport system substrate-specific component
VRQRGIERGALLTDIVLMGLGALLVALFSQVVIPLPFTPVPVTGQTLAVLLVGALLGSRRGAGSLLMYLASGVMGLPVFSSGMAGLARLAGPTGGYLLGFVAAAFVVGMLCERWVARHPAALLPTLIVGSLVIYLFGVSWLAVYVGIENSLAMGLLPFIPGDLVKLALVAVILQSCRIFLDRSGENL